MAKYQVKVVKGTIFQLTWKSTICRGQENYQKYLIHTKMVANNQRKKKKKTFIKLREWEDG